MVPDVTGLIDNTSTGCIQTLASDAGWRRDADAVFHGLDADVIGVSAFDSQ